MLWFGMLFYYLVFQVVTWIITPLLALPFFVEDRLGWRDNGSYEAVGPRLKKWLFLFDTDDNCLDGDTNHINKYGEWPAYLRHTIWLYRNSLYGLKRIAMSAWIHFPSDIVFTGNPAVNRNNGVTGLFRARYLASPYWQFKLVKKLIGDWGVMWNFGWQLDTLVSDRRPGLAMFQFSPRIVKIK